MRSKVLFLGVSSLSVLIALTTAVACSSTTTTTTNPAEGDEAGKTPTTEAGKKDTSTTEETDSSTSTDPDQACADEATATACATCCGPTNHASGYAVFVGSLTECACSGTGAADGGAAPCATDCATGLCKTPPAQPDQTCNTCLQTSVNNGACAQHVSDKCGASADCMAQQKCVAKCQGKPQ
jgi:hypothetical protein